ncbi:Folate-biopterin transporter [Phytophthora cactorum]|nr:Folate-biopterin transporter [Phytophthora cactorum]
MYSFPQATIEFFPRSLGASDAQLSTVTVVRALPWTFKVLFGLLPDVFPIHGLRFTPYLFLGCVTASLFYLMLSIYSASDSLTIASFALTAFRSYSWCGYGGCHGRCTGGTSSVALAAKITEKEVGGVETTARRTQGKDAIGGSTSADYGVSLSLC